ncbi:nose resistant to fluoxetine protein 6-like isoform X2 [Portunus trituberculatus]|uniref:nose resistant to fluoxetine protein 6-like isoform X2 n=1 Tax=Portunus trituberculatus TaxID=210409 RepID=UPI001E1CE1B7|nr:nose resistant to fluoxetine protein 6-like isoform X2 [Portunus trituberculatus]
MPGNRKWEMSDVIPLMNLKRFLSILKLIENEDIEEILSERKREEGEKENGEYRKWEDDGTIQNLLSVLRLIENEKNTEFLTERKREEEENEGYRKRNEETQTEINPLKSHKTRENEEKQQYTHERKREMEENEEQEYRKLDQQTQTEINQLETQKERKKQEKPRNSHERKREMGEKENGRGRKWETNPRKLPGWVIAIIQKYLEELWVKVQLAFSHVIGYYVPSNDTGLVSEECAVDVDDANFLNNYHHNWFWEMFDSWGKFPDGFLFGNLRAPGMYEECLKVKVEYKAEGEEGNVTREYRGRYCSVFYRPKPANTSREAVLPNQRSGVSLATLGSPLPFSYGTCVPSTCTREDVEVSLREVLLEDGLQLVEVHCHSHDPRDDQHNDYTPEQTAMLSLLSVFGALAVTATLYEALAINCNVAFPATVRSFSLWSNLRLVFTYEQGKETGDVITCLPMLRVTTMLWIIICHQYETNLDFLYNTLDSLKYQDPVVTQIVTNGWIAVDTFFFLTGLTLTFRLLPYLSREAGLLCHVKTILTVVLRRVLRLSPIILCVALFCASFLPYLGWGPRLHVLQSFQENCVQHWWKDPLFINNYAFPGNTGDDVNDCLSHCWYTAVDVQLLVLLPILLLPLLYHRVAGLAVLFIVSVGSVVVPLTITICYNLPPSPLHHLLGEGRLQYMTHIFMAPWARAGPWVVGVWAAMLLRMPELHRIKMNKVVVVLGYVAAITLGLTLVLGLYPYNHLRKSLNGVVEREWQDYPAVAYLYGSLARPAWGLCVAWVVVTCHTGNAASVNRVLSYPGWLPLARVSFPLYVVAPVVQVWWASVQLQPTYYNYLSKLFESAGVIFISLLISLLLSCFVELPVNLTCNLLLPSPAKAHEMMMKNKYKNNNNKNLDRTTNIPMKDV